MEKKKLEEYGINVRIINLFRYYSPDGEVWKQKDFAEAINVLPARVNKIFNYQNRPDVSFLENLVKAYPRLNCRWLLTGDGELEEPDVDGLLKRIKELESQLKSKRHD